MNSGLALVFGMSAAAVVTGLVRSVGAEWSARRLLRAGWADIAAVAAPAQRAEVGGGGAAPAADRPGAGPRHGDGSARPAQPLHAARPGRHPAGPVPRCAAVRTGVARAGIAVTGGYAGGRMIGEVDIYGVFVSPL